MVEELVGVQVQTTAEDAGVRVEFGVLHEQVALVRDALLGTLNDGLGSSEHRQTDLVADEVRVARDLNELGVLVSVTKLAYESLLDDLLRGWLVVEDLDGDLLGNGGVLEERWRLLLSVLLVGLRCRRLAQGQSLELVHDLDALGQSLRGLGCPIHFDHVLVHLVKVRVDELVHDLRGQVHPDVENPVLLVAFECLLQVLLYIGHDDVSAPEVHSVPLSVGLALGLPLQTNRPVGQEVVDEFNREDLDFRDVLEGRDVDVLPLSDIEEDSIDEEQERFNIEELAP